MKANKEWKLEYMTSLMREEEIREEGIEEAREGGMEKGREECSCATESQKYAGLWEWRIEKMNDCIAGNVQDMLKTIREEESLRLLSDFSCPLNSIERRRIL